MVDGYKKSSYLQVILMPLERQQSANSGHLPGTKNPLKAGLCKSLLNRIRLCV